jgi:peptide-methionine (S)-S-oxide reductase
MEKATFAAGCFWGVEKEFSKVKGVLSTAVGYAGGQTKNPDYKQVCTGKTGHAEAIDIEFDPKQVSYKELLDVFWNNHNPTTINRQGLDIGTQYRSSIFYHNEKQKKAAIDSKKKLEDFKRWNKKIVTQIVHFTEFYKAEEYHQKYFEKKKRFL